METVRTVGFVGEDAMIMREKLNVLRTTGVNEEARVMREKLNVLRTTAAKAGVASPHYLVLCTCSMERRCPGMLDGIIDALPDRPRILDELRALYTILDDFTTVMGDDILSLGITPLLVTAMALIDLEPNDYLGPDHRSATLNTTVIRLMMENPDAPPEWLIALAGG